MPLTALIRTALMLLPWMTVLAVESPSLHTMAMSTDPDHAGAVVLTWSGDADGWAVQRSIDNRTYTIIGTADAAGSFRDDSAPADTLLIYRLERDGRHSNWNYLRTPCVIDDDAEPSRPAPVAARWVDASTVRLTWADDYRGETGFTIERKRDDETVFTPLATVAADQVVFEDDTADWTCIHTYRIRATGPSASPWSLEVPAVLYGDYQVYIHSGSTLIMAPATTVAADLDAPTAPMASAVHGSRIDLSWDPVAGASAYRILASWDDRRWIEIAETTETAYQHDGVLIPGRARSYRICPVDDASALGPWSPPVTVTPPAPVADLAAPEDLVAQEEDDGIRLTWTDAADDETGYAIASASSHSAHFERIATVAAGSTDHLVADGSRFSTYRVTTLRDGDESNYAACVVPGPTRPAAGTPEPALSEDGIELSWDAPDQGHPNGYTIERRTDAEDFVSVGWVAISEHPSWTDRTPPTGTTVYYRIHATGYIDRFPRSDTASIASPAHTAAPHAPATPLATGVARDQINLHWLDLARYETGYQIERRGDDDVWTVIADLPADCRCYSDTGVSMGIEYEYRILALNEHGSGVSATVSASPADEDPAITVDQAVTIGHCRRLVVHGTAANDTIIVGADGDALVVEDADGIISSHPGPIDEVVIHAGAGDDTIIVDEVVTCRALVHAGHGADILTATGPGRSTLVAIGGGADILTGNGIDTAYWCDHLDTVHAGDYEVTAGRVHRIDTFHQPLTFDRTSADYIDNEPDHGAWEDPEYWSYPGETETHDDHSLWGRAGAVLFDVNQGPFQNCGDTGFYQLVAGRRPDLLEDTLCPLGDGTYAYRMGTTGRYARVDGDINPTRAATLGPSASIWWPIMEKAYFAWDLPAPLDGTGTDSVSPVPGDDDALYDLVRDALDRCHLVMVRTEGEAHAGATLVRQGHRYGVVEAYRAADGSPRFILRNPYGWHDGASHNHELIADHADHGLVTLTATQLRANVRPVDIHALPGHERSIIMKAIDDCSWTIDPQVGRSDETQDGERFFDLDRRQEHRLIPVASGDG